MRRWTAAGLSLLLYAGAASAAAYQAQADTGSIVGVWTLNKDASDATPERPKQDGGEHARGGGGGGGGRGHRGGGGGGGFGHGGGGGGGMGARGGDQEDVRRRMQAVRDVMDAPERITITQTDSLVIITAGDGRTTRLSPDGKKIKDESTGLERKTRRENGTLVTEITGGPAKMVETYAVDPEHHQLTVTVRTDDSQMRKGGVIRHVYDAEHGQ
jgi:hypothetical protein